MEEVILDKIGELNPFEFENFIFDCARAVGLKNVIWRTPGADGGRDIQGEAYSTDISGHELVQRWYIECKRYASSLDWPTVWNKIAYADVQGADVLLIATNSNPSPRCETEVEAWNSERRRPIVRFWRGYDLPAIVRAHPAIGASYGLIDEVALLQASTLPLAMLVSKIAQTAYAESAFESAITISLEAGAAIAELLSQALDNLQRYGRLKPGSPASQIPNYDWLNATGTIGHWGELGLRAALSALMYVRRASKMDVRFDGEVAQVGLVEPKFNCSKAAERDIAIVSHWSTIEILKDAGSNNGYKLVQRTI